MLIRDANPLAAHDHGLLLDRQKLKAYVALGFRTKGRGELLAEGSLLVRLRDRAFASTTGVNRRLPLMKPKFRQYPAQAHKSSLDAIAIGRLYNEIHLSLLIHAKGFRQVNSPERKQAIFSTR